MKSTKVDRVADILERERESTIQDWLNRVNRVPELTTVALSDADRMGHLPQLFNDLIQRLRLARDVQPGRSVAVSAHGRVRFAQGYSTMMLIEESRLLQVSTFGMLHFTGANSMPTKYC